MPKEVCESVAVTNAPLARLSVQTSSVRAWWSKIQHSVPKGQKHRLLSSLATPFRTPPLVLVWVNWIHAIMNSTN
jgi:hypothetical protein